MTFKICEKQIATIVLLYSIVVMVETNICSAIYIDIIEYVFKHCVKTSAIWNRRSSDVRLFFLVFSWMHKKAVNCFQLHIHPLIFCTRRFTQLPSLPIQHLCQVFRLQVGITPEHLQSLVPCDGRNLHRIQPLFEEPTCGLVAEIVKCNIGEELGIRF